MISKESGETEEELMNNSIMQLMTHGYTCEAMVHGF